MAVHRTVPTLQVVVNPLVRRGSRIHDKIFNNLQELGADFVRYAFWYPYPRVSVAELDPPSANGTSWNFSFMDPLVDDFMRASGPHPSLMSICTLPKWFFQDAPMFAPPANPDKEDWSMFKGWKPVPGIEKLAADYFRRVYSWYALGGFTDEQGIRRESGYHYQFPVWEVLNEPEYEHGIAPQVYAKIYDSVYLALKPLAPKMKFAGAALAEPTTQKGLAFLRYFLDGRNHAPGTAIDLLTYHFYAKTSSSKDVFAQTDDFLAGVRKIEEMRKALSPSTRTDIDELGTLAGEDPTTGGDIPPQYWNQSAAVFAYAFAELSKLGIEIVTESQYVGLPGQYPSVSMVDWNTGEPNARFWILKLIKSRIANGHGWFNARSGSPDVYAAGIQARNGARELMLVNKTGRPVSVRLDALGGATSRPFHVESVESPSGGVSRLNVTGATYTLGAFGVAFVSY